MAQQLVPYQCLQDLARDGGKADGAVVIRVQLITLLEDWDNSCQRPVPRDSTSIKGPAEKVSKGDSERLAGLSQDAGVQVVRSRCTRGTEREQLPRHRIWRDQDITQMAGDRSSGERGLPNPVLPREDTGEKGIQEVGLASSLTLNTTRGVPQVSNPRLRLQTAIAVTPEGFWVTFTFTFLHHIA